MDDWRVPLFLETPMSNFVFFVLVDVSSCAAQPFFSPAESQNLQNGKRVPHWFFRVFAGDLCATEPFSQVLKELGIEDPLLNVAQELEKVTSRLMAPKVCFCCEKKRGCFEHLG